jgi:tRNA A-37 threonylcarbamoyl transferase component Bud32
MVEGEGPASTPDHPIGATVAHFRIVEKLGEGGMGTVYKGEDSKLGRTVALKFLSKKLSGDPTASERFLREARAIAALNHPHICTIFETGTFEGRPFFAMEYLEGRTLREVIADGPLDPEALLSVAHQLADALREAHSKGILHRDLKPANVVALAKGRVKLLDFGLAKSLSRAVKDDSTIALSNSPTLERSLTQSGSTVGTVAYMSPEQVRGEELDVRSDLFALGVVLYEAATGRQPFTGKSIGSIFEAILHGSPKPIIHLNPQVPAPLATVIEHLLEKDPEDRCSTANEVRDELVLSPASEARSRFEVRREDSSFATLGVRRSSAHVWTFWAGTTLVIAALTFMVADPAWQAAIPLGLLGLLICAASPAVRWIERRREKETSVRGVALVRFSRSPESESRWTLLWWFMLFLGMVSLVGAVSSWWVWRTKGGTAQFGWVLFTAFWAVWFLAHFVYLRRFRTQGRTRTHKETAIELEGSFAQILARCSQAISQLGAHVTDLDLSEGSIHARTAMSMKSAGERIRFQVRATDQDRYSVRVESDLVNPLKLWDYGKNAANLRKVIASLLE